MPYGILFDRDARDDLKQLRKYDRTAILDIIERFLTHAPTQEQGTRIKTLAQPAISQFRLRVDEFRVYYDVDDDGQQVYVLRVCEKGRRTTAEVTAHEDH